MKITALLCAAASAFIFSGCASSPGQAQDHWNARSVAPQISRVFLGYETDVNGSYRDYQWENKQHIAKTLQRHLLNWNPDNPFQPDDPSYHAPRPNHSPLPNPLNYFHVEALVLGMVTYGMGGAFLPIPIDSILGTLEPGGPEEFVAGLSTTFKPLRVLTVSFMDDALGLPPAKGKDQGEMLNVSSHATPQR